VELKTDANVLAGGWPTYDLWEYLAALIIPLVAGTVAFCWWGLHGRDHFAALQGEDQEWYRDFAGRNVPEIQDQEIFYHNIGQSIEWAKKADVIILGSSQVMYALDKEDLQEFGERHQLRIYNMSFVGVRGGELLRQIIKKWNIRPKLWIINVDDRIIPFFSPSTDATFGPIRQKIPAIAETRVAGFLNVASRNLRWRLEDWTARIRDGTVAPSGIYRNVRTGFMKVESNPQYLAEDNRKLVIERDQNCHATSESRQFGKEFLTEIGGRTLFMLVPHSQACTLQARELSDELGVEVVISDGAGFSTIDGGGHFDKKSALKYTPFLLSAVENSAAFKEATNAIMGQR
jgi:hypothetical protein